jgi:chromosome segregation ATPase
LALFTENPQILLYVVGGAFFLGWLVAKIGAFFGRKLHSSKRDPREDRIRSLEADLRVARSDLTKSRADNEAKAKDLSEAGRKADEQSAALRDQLASIEQLRKDLRDSVHKTRELRAELSERATENVKSEVKLREVETELSVVQASSDMLATGVLDYTVNDDDDENEFSQVFAPRT